MSSLLHLKESDRSTIESYASNALETHCKALQAELMRIRSEENERIPYATVVSAIARFESLVAAAYDLMRISLPLSVEINQITPTYMGNHVARPESGWPMYDAHASIDVDPCQCLER